MKTLTRFEAISEITSSRIDTCMSDTFYLPSILEDGHKGFNNYSKEELIEEYRNEFDEDIKIKWDE